MIAVAETPVERTTAGFWEAAPSRPRAALRAADCSASAAAPQAPPDVAAIRAALRLAIGAMRRARELTESLDALGEDDAAVSDIDDMAWVLRARAEEMALNAVMRCCPALDPFRPLRAKDGFLVAMPHCGIVLDGVAYLAVRVDEDDEIGSLAVNSPGLQRMRLVEVPLGDIVDLDAKGGAR